MNNRRVQVFLVAKTFRTSDEKLQNVIKNNHGGNPLIEVIRAPKTFRTSDEKLQNVMGGNPLIEILGSPKMFSRKGLKTLMYQTRGKGVVYIFNDEFSEMAIKLATETRIPFWIISTNNGGWTSTCINRSVKDKAVRVPTSV